MNFKTILFVGLISLVGINSFGASAYRFARCTHVIDEKRSEEFMITGVFNNPGYPDNLSLVKLLYDRGTVDDEYATPSITELGTWSITGWTKEAAGEKIEALSLDGKSKVRLTFDKTKVVGQGSIMATMYNLYQGKFEVTEGSDLNEFLTKLDFKCQN